MAKKELTDLLLRKADIAEAGRSEIWDTIERGLYVRFYAASNSSGNKQQSRRVWGLRYRSQGRHRRYKLGEYPSLSLQEARKKARAFKVRIDNGQDPQAEKLEARHAVAPMTVRETADIFLSFYDRQSLRV